LSCEDGLITRIELEGTDPSYAVSNITATGYSGGVWTGSATSVELVASVAQARMTKINVYYQADERADAGLAWNPAEDIVLTVGNVFNAPILTYPNSIDAAEITIESSNTDLATVTASDVELVADATGIATITASFAGNATYKAASVSYTITVNPAVVPPTGTSYSKVTSTADITADGEYLIVYEAASKAFNGNRETLDGEGNTVDVVISEGKIAGTSVIDAAIFTIDVTNGDLRSNSGHYVGVGSYSNGMSQSDKAGTYANAFVINVSENVDITITFAGGDMHLLYNTGGRFRYYKSENSTNKAIQLYKKETVTPPTPDYGSYQRNVTSGNFGTICLPQAGTITGATLFEIAYYDETAKNIYLDEVGSAMEAGKPYIFQATASQLNVTYTSGDVVATAGNYHGLYGFYDLNNENATTGYLTQDAGNYILYQNAYWLVKDRDAYVANYRAYIKLGVKGGAPTSAQDPALGRRRVAMAVHGEQVATGVGNVQGNNVQCTKVLINGQLFILRGEKMFDATGRLVK